MKWRDLMNIKETKFEVEKSSILLIQLWGRISAGRAGCGADLAGCVSVAGFFLRPQGAITRFGGLG